MSNLISLSCSRNIAEAAKIPSWLYPCITPRSVTVAKTSSNVFVEEGEVGTAGTGGGGGGALQRKKGVGGHNTNAYTDRGVYWMGAGEVGEGERSEEEGREGWERRGRWGGGGDWGGWGEGGATDKSGAGNTDEDDCHMASALWAAGPESPAQTNSPRASSSSLLLPSSQLPPTPTTHPYTTPQPRFPPPH